jgi:hypothetical protein
MDNQWQPIDDVMVMVELGRLKNFRLDMKKKKKVHYLTMLMSCHYSHCHYDDDVDCYVHVSYDGHTIEHNNEE